MTLRPTGLAHIGIPCSDYKASVDFYTALGFEPVTKNNESGGMYAIGGCVIELYHWDGPMTGAPGAVDHIALTIDDIDAAYSEASALGFEIVTDGIESNAMFAPKSNRYFIFMAPDGVKIELAHVR